jgi:hypothetical protein
VRFAVLSLERSELGFYAQNFFQLHPDSDKSAADISKFPGALFRHVISARR